jgi:Carbohydrate binding domain
MKRVLIIAFAVSGALFVHAGVAPATTAASAASRKAQASSPVPVTAPPLPRLIQEKWVRTEGNLLVTPVEDILTIARTAKAAGANTVMFSDVKVNLWFGDPDLSRLWLPKMIALRDGVRALGMKLVLQTTPVGYCTPVLFHDPNLTTGYPIVDAPFKVRGGVLVPESTATLVNGSFAERAGARPTGWGYQDGVGTATVLDDVTKHDGSASMRFEGVGQPNGMARAFTEATVKPFHQYTLKFWMKAENLTAGYLGPVIATPGGRKLSAQHYSVSNGSGRQYFEAPRSFTRDWTEMSIAFNSTDVTSVSLGFGVWSTTAGKLWVDDIRLESTPLLNVVRRDSLPLTVRTADGREVRESIDITPIQDPLMGNIEYSGNFDTYHAAPVVKLTASSALQEADRVLVSGYHAMVTTGGQVGCSWQEPKLLALFKEIHRQAAVNIGADGYLVDLEEVRTGGWEPADSPFGSSGASLSAHTQRVLSDARAVTRVPIYTWSDMLDPTANAVGDFYQVKGTLDGSWKKIDPRVATIVNWKDLDQGTSEVASVKHFSSLGFKQLIAGFYDRDVSANHNFWKAATTGKPGIVGSMYTTWVNDYSKLTEFGNLWWR